MPQQIILRDLQRPKEADTPEDIEWLTESFGFSAGRDTERITSQILRAILHHAASTGSASTEKVSDDLGIAAQRVNYHLRTFVESGFFYREKRLVFVRQGSVKSAVEEMRKDANRIFDTLSFIAEDIDSNLGFKNRK